MAERIKAFDWSATCIGPAINWPPNLRTALGIMLGSAHAMCIAWGESRIFFYNDAYAPLLGLYHPVALGLPLVETTLPAHHAIGEIVSRVFAGDTCAATEFPLSITRCGHEVTTWWSSSFSPIRDEQGNISGVLGVNFEKTDAVLARQQRDTAANDLRASDAFLASVLNSSTDCIKVLDLDGFVAQIDRRAAVGL